MKTRKRITNVLTVTALAMVYLAVGSANAAPVTVLNPSFEAPSVPGSFSGTVTSWDTDGSLTQGLVNETLGGYGDADSGSQMSFANGGNTGPLQQTLAEIIQDGTYVLSMQVARGSGDATSVGIAGLYADAVGTVVASDTATALPLNPLAGGWDTLTVNYNPAVGDLGKTLGIYLDFDSGTAAQILFDTVTVDFEPAASTPGTLIYGK